jgi:hypothetical protein
MTPKEKAEELINKMYQCSIDGLEFNAKQCALIAVDELIYETQFEVPNIRQKYWQEVKKEILKL